MPGERRLYPSAGNSLIPHSGGLFRSSTFRHLLQRGWCKSGPIPQQDSRNHSLDVELRPSHIRSSTEKPDGITCILLFHATHLVSPVQLIGPARMSV